MLQQFIHEVGREINEALYGSWFWQTLLTASIIGLFLYYLGVL